jgi:cyclic pyranopterin phosphate synthase
MTNTALALIQEQGRAEGTPPFDYLRVSVTQRCQLHCSYCRPRVGSGTSAKEGGLPGCGERNLAHEKLLERCAAICAVAPIRKIRLSGGEPLLYPHLPTLIAALANLPHRPEIVATTTGVLLTERATELRAAGLQRLNVSLDTADRDAYRRLTGADALGRVLRGLAAAREAGFRGTKINAVLTRAHTDEDLLRLAQMAADNEAQLRFIELMPIGPGRGSCEADFVAAADRLRAAGFAELGAGCRSQDEEGARPQQDGAAEQRERFVATLADGRKVPVGIIAPMTRPFCAACRRIRLSADGRLIPCLLSPVVLSLVRGDGSLPDQHEVRLLLLRCASLKRRATAPVDGRMWAIGG